MSEQIFTIIVLVGFGLLISGIIWFVCWASQVPIKSLRQDENGFYIWLEWTGRTRRSDKDPREEGGEWHNDHDHSMNSNDF